MGDHQFMHDAYFVLFAFLVLLQVGFGTWGIMRLRRLHAGRPSLVSRVGFGELPNKDVRAALTPSAATMWRRAAAWSDVCAGISGVVFALLAIPIAAALPITSPYFLADITSIHRATVLVCAGMALSGAGSVLGRCLAMRWITPPVTTPMATAPDPLARGRRKVTALAIGLWGLDAVLALVIVLALATTAQTPVAENYVVPLYIALMLMFPFLLGAALAAEAWLGSRWRSLIRSVLSVAPHLPDAVENSFKSFASAFMSGRMMSVGFFVTVGQSLLIGQIASYQPYFGSVAVIAFVCSIAVVIGGLLTWTVPITSFTIPRDEATSTTPEVSPTS